MQENINSIVRIFPDFEKKIDFLFRTDENFQDLCKDYILCVGNILKMKNEVSKNRARIEEYVDLQQNLEQEILQMISKDMNNL